MSGHPPVLKTLLKVEFWYSVKSISNYTLKFIPRLPRLKAPRRLLDIIQNLLVPAFSSNQSNSWKPFPQSRYLDKPL